MNRLAAGVLLILTVSLGAQDRIAPRFGVDADLDRYPQKTPQDTLRSLLKAVENRRVDYVLAHVADPEFVDRRVKDTGNRFDVMVRETTAKLNADPEALRELRRFLADGEWKEQGDAASALAKDVRNKMVFFRKIGNRWYFENRHSAAKDQ